MSAANTIAAADLIDEVVVQSVTETLSATAGTSDTWTDGDTLYARVETASGRERFAADQVGSELTHKVTLRYHSSVTLTTKHRLKFETTRILNIRSIDDSRKHLGVRVLMCTEEVS